jgi:hypothetical protein
MECTGFKVVFEGEIRSGEDISQVKQRLAAMFKVDRGRIERLFSGKPVVIKTVEELGQGMKYVAALRKVGVISRIERA